MEFSIKPDGAWEMHNKKTYIYKTVYKHNIA